MSIPSLVVDIDRAGNPEYVTNQDTAIDFAAGLYVVIKGNIIERRSLPWLRDGHIDCAVLANITSWPSLGQLGLIRYTEDPYDYQQVMLNASL